MKNITKSALVIGVATLAATTVLAAPRQPTESVKFTAHVIFTNTGIEPNASGSAQVAESIKKDADHESVNVMLKGLTPETAYSLTGASTSSGGSVDLNDFTTDKKGNAKLSFNNSGKGKNTIAFPDGFLPLTGLGELDVVDGSSQTVLTATRDQVNKINYMVKKPMDDTAGNGESGIVTLSASTKKGKFSLTASGLTAETDYVIVVDGNPVSTNTSTKKGALKVNASVAPSDVLNASNISLTDTGGTTILSTVVP